MDKIPAPLDSIEHEYEVQETVHYLLFQEELTEVDRRDILERLASCNEELEQLIGEAPDNSGHKMEDIFQRSNVLYYEMGFIAAEKMFQILLQKANEAQKEKAP